MPVRILSRITNYLRPLKRPWCWYVGHDWTEISLQDGGTKYYSYCNRCDGVEEEK